MVHKARMVGMTVIQIYGKICSRNALSLNLYMSKMVVSSITEGHFELF